MRPLRQLSLGVVLLWTAAAVAAPGGNVYLAQAKVFYQGLEFEKCLQRLEQAGRMDGNTKEEMAEIELYTGLCRFNLGKREDAEANFKLALQLNPEIALPPGTSPRIAAVFDPLAAQVRKAEPPAEVAETPITTPANSTSMPTATIPDAPKKLTLEPGVTTDRADLVAKAPAPKSRVLPIALGAGAVVAAGLATTFGVMAKNHEAQANDPATFYSDAQQLGADARREAMTTNVCIGVATAAAVGAVVTWLTGE
ncbi:MAG: hypothetical protein IRZ16_14715 [Myxococcaceae bacterium]|nr:hypothetical protein [Myxococcaceae bacterium]